MLSREPDKPDPKPLNGVPPAPPTPASPPAPPRKPIDEETIARLRAGARRRRPWGLATWLMALLFVAAPVGLVAWWVWPRAEAPRLVVTAFDEVVRQGEEPRCHAQLEPAEPGQTEVALGGHDLTFEESPLAPRADRQPAKVRAATNAEGVATMQWRFPADERFQFLVRYVQPDRRDESVNHGSVFPYPKAAKLLVVDVTALAESGEKILQPEGMPSAALRPDAVAALRTAEEKQFAIVYLATGLQRGIQYQQLRNWVENHVLQPNGIPDGPLLGRLSGNSDPHALLVLGEFTGPATVLVGAESRAAPYRSAGLRTLIVGPGGLGWRDLGKELTK